MKNSMNSSVSFCASVLALVLMSAVVQPGFGAVIPPEPHPCVELLNGKVAYSGPYDLAEPKKHLFENMLGAPTIHAAVLIQYLVQHPLLQDLNLAALYDGTTGVTENFSLRAHTKMVLNTFREQEHFFHIESVKSDLDLRKLFIFMLTVHDLGKAKSLEDWSQKHNGQIAEKYSELKEASKQQYQFTVPLVKEIMKRLGFSAAEEKIVIALLDNDLVGETVIYNPQRGSGMTPNEGYARLLTKAMESQLSVADYFLLKSAYFTVDAASYPGLRYGRNFGEKASKPVFVENANGQLYAVSPYYYELAKKVEFTTRLPIAEVKIPGLVHESASNEGSTGGQWFRDQDQRRWYVKEDLFYADLQTSLEVVGSLAYRHFAYNTPEVKKYVVNGRPYVAIADIGASSEATRFDNMTAADIRRLRIVAAFLADYDRVGNKTNNRLQADGKLTLIDFGGLLGAKARGGHKEGVAFSDAVGAIPPVASIREILDSVPLRYYTKDQATGKLMTKPLAANHPWHSLTTEDIEKCIADFKNLSDDEIRSWVTAAQYTRDEDRDFLIKVLIERRNTIAAELKLELLTP